MQRISDMSATVPVRGKVFDGVSKGLTVPAKILIKGNRIAADVHR
jgi:hypothetical protein